MPKGDVQQQGRHAEHGVRACRRIACIACGCDGKPEYRVSITEPGERELLGVGVEERGYVAPVQGRGHLHLVHTHVFRKAGNIAYEITEIIGLQHLRALRLR